jgi:hypothetical protein
MTIVHWSFVVKKMPAGSFEAKCLAIMDEVQAKHEGWSSRSAASRWQSSSQLVPRRTRFTISWQARAFSRETSFPQRFRLEHPAAASFRRRSWVSLGCDLPPHDKTVRSHALWPHLSRQEKNQLQQSLRRTSRGIKEVHDDIWPVSFMNYNLGYSIWRPECSNRSKILAAII